MLLSGGNMFLK